MYIEYWIYIHINFCVFDLTIDFSRQFKYIKHISLNHKTFLDPGLAKPQYQLNMGLKIPTWVKHNRTLMTQSLVSIIQIQPNTWVLSIKMIFYLCLSFIFLSVIKIYIFFINIQYQCFKSLNTNIHIFLISISYQV